VDDALNPATALTNGAINETLQHTLEISQGSVTSVATHVFRCGGIFSDSIYMFSTDSDSEVILKIG